MASECIIEQKQFTLSPHAVMIVRSNWKFLPGWNWIHKVWCMSGEDAAGRPQHRGRAAVDRLVVWAGANKAGLPPPPSPPSLTPPSPPHHSPLLPNTPAIVVFLLIKHHKCTEQHPPQGPRGKWTLCCFFYCFLFFKPLNKHRVEP